MTEFSEEEAPVISSSVEYEPPRVITQPYPEHYEYQYCEYGTYFCHIGCTYGNDEYY
jgi:hypothetical protein